MKKNYLLGVLFFSALWGTSEAALGGILYRAHIPHASVPLTIIAFVILSLARSYLPQKGSATLIASVAMLFKFLNTPFFACHLLAIFFLGFSYDLAFSFFKVKNKALFGLAATYLGYILFALTITYVFRYHYWTAEGLPRILRYVGISGTMASLGNAIFVPISLYLGRMLKKKAGKLFELSELSALLHRNCQKQVYQTSNSEHHFLGYRTNAEKRIPNTAMGHSYNYLKTGLLTVSVFIITVGLWILGIMRCF